MPIRSLEDVNDLSGNIFNNSMVSVCYIALRDPSGGLLTPGATCDSYFYHGNSNPGELSRKQGKLQSLLRF
jgi:hypothetical protein